MLSPYDEGVSVWDVLLDLEVETFCQFLHPFFRIYTTSPGGTTHVYMSVVSMRANKNEEIRVLILQPCLGQLDLVVKLLSLQ